MPRLLLTAVASLLFATAAVAKEPKPTLRVSPTTIAPGGLVYVSGTAPGCRRGNTVFIFSRAFPAKEGFAGVGAVTTRLRSGGIFRTSARVRPRVARGTYVLTARCGGGNLGVAVRLRVR